MLSTSFHDVWGRDALRIHVPLERQATFDGSDRTVVPMWALVKDTRSRLTASGQVTPDSDLKSSHRVPRSEETRSAGRKVAPPEACRRKPGAPLRHPRRTSAPSVRFSCSRNGPAHRVSLREPPGAVADQLGSSGNRTALPPDRRAIGPRVWW